MSPRRRRILAALSLGLVLFAVPACSRGELAKPINLPNAAAVSEMRLQRGGSSFSTTDAASIKAILDQLDLAEPTRQQSVNDVPNTDNFIRLDFLLTSGEEVTVFVYRKIIRWYVELPYSGIYLSKGSVVDALDQAKWDDGH